MERKQWREETTGKMEMRFLGRKKRNFRNEKLSEANNNRVESIINRLSQTVERMSGIEGKVKEIPHSNTSKEKENKNHSYSVQDPWVTHGDHT